LTVLCAPHFLDSGPKPLNLESCKTDSQEPVPQPEVEEGNSDVVTLDLDGCPSPLAAPVALQHTFAHSAFEDTLSTKSRGEIDDS